MVETLAFGAAELAGGQEPQREQRPSGSAAPGRADGTGAANQHTEGEVSRNFGKEIQERKLGTWGE